ncbi:MAG: site-specific DNA-methyltransferase [Pyrinomonadaceae bacterium]|nr:site-specific DNA-methyltransferase [Pyrinomonadaceae bacterium]
MQETYLGKVKMIYIDPPYNTGNDFIYEDDFAESADTYFERSMQKDEQGNRLVANMDSNGRFHSDWLSMMYPRLKLARNLLRDDGVIFISIDDNESSNLKNIGDEIFGASNFIAQLAVQLNPRGRHLDWFVAKTHESVLIFAKNFDNPNTMLGVEKEGRMVDEYDRSDSRGAFRLLGLRNRNQSFNPQTRPNLYYPIYVNRLDGKVSITKDDKFTDKVLPDAPDGTQTCWTWGKDKVVAENHLLVAEISAGEWRVYRKDYLVSDSGDTAKTLVKSLWTEKEISNDIGRKSIKDLFGSSVMDFPKSPDLLKKLLLTGAKKQDIVLDFFSGSATTAHAVMQLNAEDGGNRQFIMVQLPAATDEKSEAFKAGYKTIAEIGKERIRRAGKKIKDELEKKNAENKELLFDENSQLSTVNYQLDTGFRVLKIDSSNMKDVYYSPDTALQANLLDQIANVKEDRTAEDLLFQVLVDWGIDLTLPIHTETIGNKTVHFVDENAIAACFDESGITEDFIKQLANRQPLRAVFRDSGFASDAVKINVEQIFKLISPTTEVKAI